MHIAIKALASLQDTVNLGVATASELEALNAWKTYRIALHRLDPKADEIDWPKAPRG